MQGLLQPFLEQIQDLENAIEDVIVLTELPYAEGAQLDQIGSVVVFPRIDLDDSHYARGIAAKILVNRSNGSLPDLINIVQALLGTDPPDFKITPLGSASFEVFLFGDVSEQDLRLTQRLVGLARAAGVDGQILWRDVDCTVNGFQLSSTYDTTENSAVQGLAFVGDAPVVGQGLIHTRRS